MLSRIDNASKSQQGSLASALLVEAPDHTPVHSSPLTRRQGTRINRQRPFRAYLAHLTGPLSAAEDYLVQSDAFTARRGARRDAMRWVCTFTPRENRAQGGIASGQIKLRRIDGWRKIATVLSRHTAVAA